VSRGLRRALVAVIGSSLAVSTLGALPAQAEPTGVINCSIEPGSPVLTMMDTPVGGRVVCTHTAGQPVAYSVAPYVADVSGPFNGKLGFNTGTGEFTYTPGWYPPAADTGIQSPLPEFTGPDSFIVNATSPDGAAASIEVPIEIQAPPRACDAGFTAQTRTMFNNPAGSNAAQFQMLRYLIDMIDCTPPANPDGTQATIKFSVYSMSYPPVQAALTRAAQRGVSVQGLTNSHADKYPAWRELAESLGPDTYATNFASTCWAGCLTPRSGPPAGAPTAWYSAEATTLTNKTVVFTDRSFPGTNPIVGWRWDFGDGTFADGPGPHVKEYRDFNTYKTSLTVTDAAGVRHTMDGNKTLPDNQEPMYPSLHSKIYMFSTVGTGAATRQWVSAYSSGNPTYYNSIKGFNNLNIAVGDKALYDIFTNYFGDMVAGSRGQLITPNYFRTYSSPGNAATGARPTTVHLLPQTSGDINRDILKGIKCRYKVGKKWKRTAIRVSMFVLTRRGVASDLWTLAMRKGCKVEIVYTQMSQRVKGANGKWLTNEDGEPLGWGAADCLSTPPYRYKKTKAKKGKPAKRKRVRNTPGDCSRGTLNGRVPVTSTGVWLKRTSPYSGGKLTVRMSCPVKPKYDPVKKVWAVVCIRNDIFTHNKVMMVNGFIHGKRQKYVMTGSANWSSPGLRASDELVTEIQDAPVLYKEYKKNYDYLKKIVAKNSKKKKKSKKSSIKTYKLSISSNQVLDVRGMTDEQLAGLEG